MHAAKHAAAGESPPQRHCCPSLDPSAVRQCATDAGVDECEEGRWRHFRKRVQIKYNLSWSGVWTLKLHTKGTLTCTDKWCMLHADLQCCFGITLPLCKSPASYVITKAHWTSRTTDRVFTLQEARTYSQGHSRHLIFTEGGNHASEVPI